MDQCSKWLDCHGEISLKDRPETNMDQCSKWLDCHGEIWLKDRLRKTGTNMDQCSKWLDCHGEIWLKDRLRKTETNMDECSKWLDCHGEIWLKDRLRTTEANMDQCSKWLDCHGYLQIQTVAERWITRDIYCSQPWIQPWMTDHNYKYIRSISVGGWAQDDSPVHCFASIEMEWRYLNRRSMTLVC